MANKKKPIYSFKTGLIKTLKNVCVMFGLPALLLVLDSLVTFVPMDIMIYIAPITGPLSYLLKNYLENRSK